MNRQELPRRVIPCLDVHNGQVVKGTEFVGIRTVGDPVDLARRYEAEGADELVFLDISATVEDRHVPIELSKRAAEQIFMPFTIGGNIASVADAQSVLDAGADKVAVNSAAVSNPQLISELADRFGKQCVTSAIDAKMDDEGRWVVYVKGGNVATELQAVAWAREAVDRGAGEILLTSINRDGTHQGYDLDLTRAVTDAVGVPVIASGGAGRREHFSQVILQAGADAALAASEFHSGRISISQVKDHFTKVGVPARPTPDEAYPSFAPLGAYVPVVDYGMGNRFSVLKALEKVGAESGLVGSEEELSEADGIVLPGVGAFQPAMERLRETGLDEALRRMALAGKPILGICLGEQLLFDSSEEGGFSEGLGLVEGRVEAIDTPLKPNMGWRLVDRARGTGGYFYHAHEYAALPASDTLTLGHTSLPSAGQPDYRIASIIGRGNIFGVQFHPEKSGIDGLRLLRRFVEISAGADSEL